METLRDVGIIFGRQVRRTIRNPVVIVFGLLQPFLTLVLFGPMLTQVAKTPGFPQAGNSWQVFVPGLLVQLGLFGTAFAGFAIIADLRLGIIERMRVTPMSRVAMLTGRILRDVLLLLIQAIVLFVVGVAFGLRAPLGGILFGCVFVILLGASIASLSYSVGLITKSEDSFAPILGSVTAPILLLSGIMLPMSLAPDWLQTIAHFNPFYYLVQAMRSVFVGHYANTTVLWGVLVSLGLLIFSAIMGTRTFQKENA